MLEYYPGDFVSEKDYNVKLRNKFIKYRNNLNLPKDVTFGIEIEYENIVTDTVSVLLAEEKYYDSNLKDWKNKSEIDITEYNDLYEEMNGEVISPILTDNITTWKSLEKILELLENNNGIISNKCGGHVNIGAHVLGNNVSYWKNFFLLWLLYHKEIYKFASGEFTEIRDMLDCFISEISDSLKLEDLINIKNINHFYNFLSDKRHCIYINKFIDNDIIYGNRIEFRIPNGTLSKEIWQNYINFFSKFVISCKKELDIEEISYKIVNNKGSIIDLANYVFDNEEDKEQFLIQSLKTNVLYQKKLIKHKEYY